MSDVNKNDDKVNGQAEVETVAVKKLSKEELEFQKLLQFANLARLVRKDLNSNVQTMSSFQKNFNKDDVMKWQANPQKFEKQLRKLSRFLYDSSSHYKRLVQYFATMLTFDYIVEPYGMTEFDFSKKAKETVYKKYLNIVNLLETMNLKHEFLKVCERAWIDDAVYYYEFQMKDSYFLMNLDPDFCQITGMEDGCLTFDFDFLFFNTRSNELDRYPEEFQIKYEKYKTDKKKFRWQEIDPSKSLCIKIAESVDYVIPPFSGIFEEIYSLEDYKSLKLARSEMENYLLLVAKIPYLKDATVANNFALEMNKAIEYFNLAMGEMPDSVGGMLSPFESVDAVKVDRGDKVSDYVSEAQKALYDSAGVSQNLFNSAGTGASIAKSISVDENIAFKILRQFERWINKKLKDKNKVIKFKVEFLDVTRYSKDDYIKSLKEGATLGVPNKMKYAAALGQSPSSQVHMVYLENAVLDITSNWKPLASSYTQSGDGGRPQKEDDELEPISEITRERGDNNPENRD